MTKLFRPSKPFWNEELNNLWKEVVTSEKLYLRERKKAVRQKLLQKYKTARHVFDRRFRSTKRNYYKVKVNWLESCTYNSNSFWKELNRLGPKYKNKRKNNTSIPAERWAADFQGLFDISSDDLKDDDIFITDFLTEAEDNFRSADYESRDNLGKDFIATEIKKVVKN